MAEFTLDTSGVVKIRDYEGLKGCTRTFDWDDLSPFAQGYVEAALRDFVELQRSAKPGFWVGFRHLHHEALSMILRDCEAIQATFNVSPNRSGGWQAWCVRNMSYSPLNPPFPGFPPLRVYLDDDGKVRLEAQS